MFTLTQLYPIMSEYAVHNDEDRALLKDTLNY